MHKYQTKFIYAQYAKCHVCGIRQRIENCTTDGSVQLLVDLPEDKEIWLTVFTDILETLLMKGSPALTSDSDSIEEYLLDLKDIELSYNSTKNVITDISC